MSRLSEFDFSELGHYVDCLATAKDAEERASHAGIIGNLCSTLPAPAMAAALVLEVERYAAWGGVFDRVRDEFSRLAVEHAGWSAAQAVELDRRDDAKAHGRKGGRPKTPEQDKEWLRLLDEKKQKNPNLSDTNICKRIASEWIGEDGFPRSWRTIFDGVRRAQNKV